MSLKFTPTIFLLLLASAINARIDCSRSEYERCVRIADPLVKEAHLVFPDNVDDIDVVCRTWNQFVDCLKTYTDECFTDMQRRQFNRAVESPIESVHQMCMQPSYQKEYLQYAPCIKNTITQQIHCGPHYSLLVDQVSQGEVISKSTLCCSHDRFKQCVQRETRRLCDRGLADGPASVFATQIIEKALSFLQDQCVNYIPNSGDCSPSDNFLSTASSEVFPWSTIQQDIAPKEILPTRTSSWLPNSPTPPQLGVRTRPASYGRSNGWSTEGHQRAESSSLGNTVQMYPNELSSTYTPPPSISSWTPGGISASTKRSDGNFMYGSSSSPSSSSRKPQVVSPSSTETWYPAAGNQLNNEVDEPNQLGLHKPQNGGLLELKCNTALLSGFLVLLFLLLD